MVCVLGKVRITDGRAVDHKLIRSMSQKDLALGWYDPGHFAWFLGELQAFEKPNPVSGGRGLQFDMFITLTTHQPGLSKLRLRDLVREWGARMNRKLFGQIGAAADVPISG